MSDDLLYIVPAYNEGKKIREVIERIKKHDTHDGDIIVIDDHSTDDTRNQVVQEDVKIISHPINLGAGAALRTGFKYAVRENYDYVLCIDGDGQHDPGYMDNVLKPTMENDADLCIGSRFLEGASYDMPFVRWVGNTFYAKVTSIMSGHSITDATSGYRAINRDLFSKYAENYPDDIWAIEATIWAGRHGFAVDEVSVDMDKREVGDSHISPLKLIKYPFVMIYAIFRAL